MMVIEERFSEALEADGPSVPLVCVGGDVDADSAPALHAVLDEVLSGHPHAVVVDVSAVTHFSCAALDALCAARGAVDGHVTLVGAGRAVRRLLSVLGLESAFGVTGNDRVSL